MADSVVRKKISELLVKDLKAELEKRGLDQKGVKAVLLERLEEALKENGEDPDNMLFDASFSPKTVRSINATMTELDEMEEDEDENQLEDEELTIGDEDDDDVMIELVDDSDEENLEDIYGDMEVTDAGQDEGEDVFDISMDNVQFISQEDEKYQEDDIEDDIEDDEGEEGAELVTEEAEDEEEAAVTSDPTSATKSGDEDSVVEHVETERVEAEGPSSVKESTKSQPDKVDSTGRDGEQKAETDGRVPENSEKASMDTESSSKETKLDNKETDKTAPGKTPTNKDSTVEKNSARSTGTVAPRSKSLSSARKNPPKDDKDSRRSKASSSTNCNVWVSGLSKETRAADLKTAFSRYGKVIGAKVIWNAKLPGHHCYGFLSMASNAEATKAINRLHRTHLHGRTIDVTWARNQASSHVVQNSSSPPSTTQSTKDNKEVAVKKPAAKPAIKDVQDVPKKDDKAPAAPEKDDKASSAKKSDVVEKETEKKVEMKSAPLAKTSVEDKSNKSSPRSLDSTKKNETLLSGKDSSRQSSSQSDRERKDKIKVQQRLDYNRRCDARKEREEREAEHRRNKERDERIRREREEIQSRQREEVRKLRKERELLEIEKSKLEKERTERHRIEKERIKLEQDRLKFQRELEEHRKMEIQLKIEQGRLTTLKRTLETQAMAQQAIDPYSNDHKRRAMMQEGITGSFNNPIPTDTRLVVAVGERHVEKYDQRDLRQGQGLPAQRDVNQAQFGNQQQSDQSGFSGGLRDSNSGSRFRESSSQRRDDRGRTDVERKYEPSRRENNRQDDSRQRSVNRNNDPPRREDGSRKTGDSYRRDEGYSRLSSRRDSRDAQDRDERRVVANNQNSRYQGSSSGREGDSSYSSRDSQRDNRDYRDSRDKPRDSSRMPTHGGNHDKGTGGSGSDWKSNIGGSNPNLDHSKMSHQFGSYQQQKQDFPLQTSSMQDMSMRMGGNTSLSRGDVMMNQQQPQQQIRSSILGDPPAQESASWPPSGLDVSMNRGVSGSLGMQGTPNMMNQNQQMSSMMNNPNSMSGQFMSGGGASAGIGGNMSSGGMSSVSQGGGFGGNVGMMSQGPVGGNSYMGSSQMAMGMSGANVGMDQLQQMQPDNRFAVRRY